MSAHDSLNASSDSEEDRMVRNTDSAASIREQYPDENWQECGDPRPHDPHPWSDVVCPGRPAYEYPYTERLAAIPMTRDEANAFVGIVHRHLRGVVSHRFAVGAILRGQLVGVAMVGNTKARGLHDRFAAEITRCATDGTRNAPSFLYARCRRVWETMGGDPRKLVTYNLESEGGASLRAAGFVPEAEVKGREWDTPSRPRDEKGGAQVEDKIRWRAVA